MHVYDVDGDGDGDVITSLAAHGYGLSWFEQIKKMGRLILLSTRSCRLWPKSNSTACNFRSHTR